MKTRSKTPIRYRLSSAIAAAALLSAGGSAQAVEANLVLEYECPFPIIGNQVITADISADIPAEQSVGDTEPFTVTAITTVPEAARDGLAVGRATTIEGTAISSAIVRTVARDIPADVELTVPRTDVSEGEGSFELPAEGTAPSVTLEQQDVGQAEIRVGDLFLDMITREEDGSIAIQPIGEFTSDCVQLPGQDNVLHTFEVVGDNPPDIEVTPDAVDFGVLQSGMSSDEEVAIANVGGDGLEVGDLSVQGPDADLFSVVDDCDSLSADTGCTATVTYSAMGEAGHEATLVIPSNDPDEATVEVPLTGVSEEVPQPSISVDPESLDFGTVQAGQTPEDVITVSNDGGASLGIQNISLAGDAPSFFMITDDCNSLAPTETCTMTVTYLADGEATHNAIVVVESGDPENPVVEVPVTGTSEIEATPEISVNPEDVDFGVVELGTSVEEAVVVSNTGGAALTIEDIRIHGDAAEDFSQVNDCTTLVGDEPCTVTVTYTSNVEGERNAVLSITSDDPDTEVVDVPLSASGESVTPPDQVDLRIDGDTFIRSSQGTLPINGNLIGDFDESNGMLSGFLDLERTEGQLRVSRFFRRLTATVAITFEEVEETTGLLEDGTLTTQSRLYFRVPHATVNFFGLELPLAGGEECRTMDPVELNLSSPEGETFSIREGGQLSGDYDLPPLENCGPFTDVLNSLMAGSDNTMELTLSEVDGGDGNGNDDNDNE
ncbi:MAG: choice-of-anchor D domain-containing protein [Oleiphilaceae bacterium]|nr:choice-of-anchor D domain-containing protein [Oleiphilaceae bacterium]